jgi:hypothetical protein
MHPCAFTQRGSCSVLCVDNGMGLASFLLVVAFEQNILMASS